MTDPYEAIPLETRRTNWGWFGDPWPSYVCYDENDRLLEEMRKPVPVGEDCLLCEEPFEEGHSGTAMPTADQGGCQVRHVHKECSLRQVLGPPEHLDGECRCREPGGTGRTYREEALALWQRLTGAARP